MVMIQFTRFPQQDDNVMQLTEPALLVLVSFRKNAVST
jgi:hypothetical protein